MEHRAPVPILPVASTTGTHHGIDFARTTTKPPPGWKLSVDYHLTTTSGCATGHGAGWLKVSGERTYLLPPGSVP